MATASESLHVKRGGKRTHKGLWYNAERSVHQDSVHSKGEDGERGDPFWLEATRKRKESGRSFETEGTGGREKQWRGAAWNTNARAVEGIPDAWD